MRTTSTPPSGFALALIRALSLALVVTSPLIATAFGVPGLTAVLRVFAVYPLLMALTVVPEALLTREMRFGASAMRQIVGSVAGCVVAVTLVFVGAGSGHSLRNT